MKMKNLFSKSKQACSNAYAKAGVIATMGLASTGAFAVEQGSSNPYQLLIDSIDVASIKADILNSGGVVIGIAVTTMIVLKLKSMLSR